MSAMKMKPVHPGVILLEEFLTPMSLTCSQIAGDLKIPVMQIDEIIQGKRNINAETALRLARYFSNSAQFWFGLQMDYDLDSTSEKEGDKIQQEVQVYQMPD
jgi:antitoxin HigA-1